MPVSLVIHRDEIHEEHVVSHRVHPKYLHLEGGEHAPGTERREKCYIEEQQGAPRGQHGSLPLQLLQYPPSCDDKPPRRNHWPEEEADTPKLSGKTACCVLQPSAASRKASQRVLPLPLAAGPVVHVRHPKCPTEVKRRGQGKQEHPPPLLWGDQVKIISFPWFPHHFS